MNKDKTVSILSPPSCAHCSGTPSTMIKQIPYFLPQTVPIPIRSTCERVLCSCTRCWASPGCDLALYSRTVHWWICPGLPEWPSSVERCPCNTPELYRLYPIGLRTSSWGDCRRLESVVAVVTSMDSLDIKRGQRIWLHVRETTRGDNTAVFNLGATVCSY